VRAAIHLWQCVLATMVHLYACSAGSPVVVYTCSGSFVAVLKCTVAQCTVAQCNVTQFVVPLTNALVSQMQNPNNCNPRRLMRMISPREGSTLLLSFDTRGDVRLPAICAAHTWNQSLR
jgi:hypothetical protein